MITIIQASAKDEKQNLAYRFPVKKITELNLPSYRPLL